MNDIILSIREHRKKKKISQQRLADMIGVNRHAVKCWETGRRDIRFSNLLKLCDALGLKITLTEK